VPYPFFLMVGALPARRVPLFTKLTADVQRFSIFQLAGGDCHPKKLNGLIGSLVVICLCLHAKGVHSRISTSLTLRLRLYS